MFTEIYCIVTGKVQRVGFRAFVESIAREHGVFGWVQNQGGRYGTCITAGTSRYFEAV